MLQGCSRGDSCGFKHLVYESADGGSGDYRLTDPGHPARRGDPPGRGRGRGFRDGPHHPGRWGISYSSESAGVCMHHNLNASNASHISAIMFVLCMYVNVFMCIHIYTLS